jgi:hypothetical protein
MPNRVLPRLPAASLGTGETETEMKGRISNKRKFPSHKTNMDKKSKSNKRRRREENKSNPEPLSMPVFHAVGVVRSRM